ncbi:MAG TPA: hypothetical protein PKA28_17575 [Methylomusa anaerophila]|uniref:Uncharacterized protein n=1 Tax=Methylomusa anaerophila TaxID=1930071 RepID=A0A348AMI7_9FIRM|nr:hypothetical protein [Methylomusa anaerophila]BBB92285.1 hypothetical protein MAMMFC1_02970 [Methylomusa anaerophila]HML90254.1 hypothetical protein [Methylomusa anaerophila]
MFKINRLKIIVKTNDGDFGFDESFHERINFVASFENTKGKSSAIEAIYYCLGFEELIGGKNDHALKPVFRKTLEFDGVQKNVLESNFYLEIKNIQGKVITVYRTANKDNVSPTLISVFDGDINDALVGKVIYEDMYVHQPGSATNARGFHRFLESFLGWKLPEVPTFDNNDRKLYIQTVFAATFIEQKRGWSNILATIPTNFRIKDVRQRVIEFIIGLHTLENERCKQKCKAEENRIKHAWCTLFSDINSLIAPYQIYIQGIPSQPEILSDEFSQCINFLKKQVDQPDIYLDQYLKGLEDKLIALRNSNLRVVDNSEELQEELAISKEKAKELEQLIDEQRDKLILESDAIIELKKSFEIINKDLQNNKDAQKIKKMGSTQDWYVNKDICPTCHQKIDDSLLPQSFDYNLMSIDANIENLLSQKAMLEFGLNGHRKNVDLLRENIQELEKDLVCIRRIIRSIVNDIYSTDNSISETIVYKKLMFENQIEQIQLAHNRILELIPSFRQLSIDWKSMLSEKKSLPQDKYSESDLRCLKSFEETFRKNLKDYGYTSFTNIHDIEIAKDNLQPTVAGFDMKFDSSASDHIRAIWAFTTALLMTAKKCGGNHPGILIFDEPDQQSTIVKDMEHFLASLTKLNAQVIIGITLKDEEIKSVLSRIDQNICKIILIDKKVIAPIASIELKENENEDE